MGHTSPQTGTNFTFEVARQRLNPTVNLLRSPSLLENPVEIPAQDLEDSKGDRRVVTQEAQEVVASNEDVAGGLRFRCYFVGLAGKGGTEPEEIAFLGGSRKPEPGHP